MPQAGPSYAAGGAGDGSGSRVAEWLRPASHTPSPVRLLDLLALALSRRREAVHDLLELSVCLRDATAHSCHVVQLQEKLLIDPRMFCLQGVERAAPGQKKKLSSVVSDIDAI